MAMLLSLYEGVTKVVQGINDIDHDCSSFCELISNIQQLKHVQCLESVDNILQGLCKSNLVLCFMLGAGAVICVILGAALIPTPAVAATLPLLITGGVLAWQSSVHLGVAAFTNNVTAVVDQSKEIGYYKGQELLKEPNVEDSCTIDILVLIDNHIITLQLVQYELPTDLYGMTYYIITSLHHV